MAKVHPSAEVSPQSNLAPDVEIGPRCTLKGAVTLGPGVRLIGDVYLQGPITIGAGTIIYPFTCLGFEPQDVKFKLGQATAGIAIGANCIIREHVTIHQATSLEVPTSIGDRVFLMVSSHVGHDASVGSDAVIVNACALGGHSSVGERAIMGGGAVLHQFNRLGRLSMVSGGSVLSTDVPPFCMAYERNSIIGLNLVGMRRSGMPREHIAVVRQAFREVFKLNPTREQMLERLDALGAGCPPVQEMAQFVRTVNPRRTLCPFRSPKRAANEVEGAEVV